MTESSEAASFFAQWKWQGIVLLLALGFSWLACRGSAEKQAAGSGLLPVLCALAVIIPWLTGHLQANGINYFFPPSAGLNWLIFGSLLWPVLLVTSGFAAKHKAAHDPVLQEKRRARLAAGATLLLAGALFYLCQERVPWVFRSDETPADRAWTAAAVTAGGLLLCAGQGSLVRLLPAAGFWLCQIALGVPLALAVRASNGPAWLGQVQTLLPVIAAGWLVSTLLTRRTGSMPAIVGIWCGVLAGLPFLWSAVSRTDPAQPNVLLLLAGLPPVCAILLSGLRNRLHPVGFSLAAAALMLAGGTAVLKFSAVLDTPPAAPATTGADDSGAYD